ncbi:MAG: 4-hydroxy-tetrahydrodipicolinate synthase [Acidimicrobiales bacterium]|jgi:4-hydroxy-tetrahydrodipicolinate synthase
MNPTFGRVLSAMVTPFDENEDLDLDAAQALASWLVESQGHEGLVLAGTTGESPTLTHDEQGQLFRAVREAVNVPIIAGTGSNNTRAAVDLTKRAVQAGVDGLLVVTPYYNRPSQAALVDHFTAVAAAGDDVPTLIYDIPARAGRKVETENLLTLAHDVSNIVGIKDAAGDPAETAMLLTQAPDGFEIYSGDDSLTLPLMAIGAIGAIGVATHWTGPEHVQMFAAFASGDVVKARKLNAMMLPSFGFESMPDAPNPIPTKAMLRMLGHSVGTGRSPMHMEPPGLEAAARAIIEGSGLAIEASLPTN